MYSLKTMLTFTRVHHLCLYKDNICSKVTLGSRRHENMLTSTQYDPENIPWTSIFDESPTLYCVKDWGYKELSGIHSAVFIRIPFGFVVSRLRVAINSILDLDSPIPLCL